MAKFEYQPPSSAAASDQKVPKNPLLQQQDANGLPPATIDALRTAAARAEANKLELLKSPEMLNGEDLSVELGLSRATVDNRRVVGKLLALEFGSKRGYRYPRWQRELLQEGARRVAF